jgi:acetone carboxylase gamma subunit
VSDAAGFSPSLSIIDTGEASRRIACRGCGCALCATDGVWKNHAVLDETPLAQAGGELFAAHGSEVLLRRFYCPSCGALLDAETALPGEPFLVDRVRG